MGLIKKGLQSLGVIFLPGIASALFLGMAIQGNGIVRVSKHLFRNVKLLGLRLPKAFVRYCKEDSTYEDSSKSVRILTMIVGLPFLIVFLLLDDYEE